MKTLLDWSPALVGELLVLGLVLGGIKWKLRQRAQVGERPPQIEKLLRPPGHHLQKELERTDETLVFTILHLIGSSAIAGVGVLLCFRLGVYLWRTKPSMEHIFALPNWYLLPSVMVLTVMALGWGVWSLRRVFRLAEDGRNYRLGLLGELAVAQALQDPRLAATGYVVFHDVPGDGKWNVDHVIVGPAGIFVIETKTRHRRKSTHPTLRDWEVAFDGQVLTYPWCVDREAWSQVERNAYWLKKFVAPFAPQDLRVKPIVVLPGSWWIKAPVKEHSQMVMNPGFLVKYLANAPRLYDPQDLQGIRAKLDERCRTVEF